MMAKAALVAAVLYSPLAITLALLCAAFGVPLHAFVTFGDALNLYAGMLAWWLGAFALALLHVALAFPWAYSRTCGDFIASASVRPTGRKARSNARIT